MKPEIGSLPETAMVTNGVLMADACNNGTQIVGLVMFAEVCGATVSSTQEMAISLPGPVQYAQEAVMADTH